MITPVLLKIFERDLTNVSEELNLYKDDASLWELRDGFPVTGGNLCLHIAGNLQHFIGTVLGDTGYVRNKNAEFSAKNIPRQKLLELISDTKTVVRDTLEQITKKELEGLYPQQVLDEPVSTEYFLIHLLTHLNYHFGQINLHRKMVAATTEEPVRG
jgi:uncharacterized damage-inducible protein DinB